MIKLGITGGVGSGKSKVLEFMKDNYSAYICQADDLGRQLQSKGENCYTRIVQEFGTDILDEDGSINRKSLGQLALFNPEAMEKLNSIVHPAVNQRLMELIENEKNKGTKLFVFETALLSDKINLDILDEIWYIHVKESVRRERLKLNRGYNDEKIDGFIQNQFTESQYEKSCARTIENNEDFENTKAQILKAMEELAGDRHEIM